VPHRSVEELYRGAGTGDVLEMLMATLCESKVAGKS
jgi:hypothetical protein